VATVGLGYADGLLRSASNRGLALWWQPPLVGAGRAESKDAPVYRLPLLGRISMDSCVVDLTGVPEGLRPAEGQMVEVIGPHQHPEVVACAAGTIGYEILTSLGRRFRRQYLQ
jgi:alanine racemase